MDAKEILKSESHRLKNSMRLPGGVQKDYVINEEETLSVNFRVGDCKIYFASENAFYTASATLPDVAIAQMIARLDGVSPHWADYFDEMSFYYPGATCAYRRLKALEYAEKHRH